MDLIDKRILFYLLKDGRIPQRRIAELLNLTPASLNYRFKKLMDDGILKGFKLFVNPNFYGYYQAFVAFKNYNDIDADWIVIKLKCLEWFNVYGVQAKDTKELKDRIDYMRKELGEPVMSYFPVQTLFRPSNIAQKIISELKKDPRIPSSTIAKNLGVNTRTVDRHIRYLKHRGLIFVVPEINLGKADIVIFSIFSKRIDEVTNALQECKLWQFTDGYAGITVCYADNMEKAKKYISTAREFDKDADVMIIYDYVFK
ncbi:MAG: winged helix-turn-helix transcriptional regulator [Sulfolobaceae archaeon]